MIMIELVEFAKTDILLKHKLFVLQYYKESILLWA